MEDFLIWIQENIISLLMLLLTIGIGVHLVSSNTTQTITKKYAETIAVNGGFTTYQYDEFKKEIKASGFNDIKIEVTANTSTGDDISTQAMNVTPKKQDPYPMDPKYIERGNSISIKIQGRKNSVLSEMLDRLGIEQKEIETICYLTVMSERVE